MGGGAEPQRRSLRPDLPRRPGVRRSASAAPRRCRRSRAPAARPLQRAEPGGEAVSYTGPPEDAGARARTAYRPDPEGAELCARRDRAPARARSGLMSERIIAKKEGAVGWLIFNNPERRNAVSVDMWEAIPSVLAKFESDQEVRVVVLAGAGDKAFVSGADISQFESQRSSQEAVQRYEEIAEAAQARLQTLDKPVLAMIRGYCLGAGVNIANVCDLRIAGDDARFGIPAAKMGLGYRASSMKNLVDTVGAPYAREIMITGRQVTATEAKDMRLVHRRAAAEHLARCATED